MTILQALLMEASKTHREELILHVFIHLVHSYYSQLQGDDLTMTGIILLTFPAVIPPFKSRLLPIILASFAKNCSTSDYLFTSNRILSRSTTPYPLPLSVSGSPFSSFFMKSQQVPLILQGLFQMWCVSRIN